MPLDIFTPLDVSTQQISHDFVQLDVYKAQKIDCDSFSDFYLMVRLSQIMYFPLLHFILFILLNTKYTILFLLGVFMSAFFPHFLFSFLSILEIVIFTYSEVFYSAMSSLLGSSNVFFILLVLLISSIGEGPAVVFFIRISGSLFALLICFCILSCFIF